MSSIVFQLLVIFQVKHFMGDFPFQSQYMLRKELPTWDFFKPLMSHALVHSFMTLVICLIYNPKAWWLCPLDILLHFIMDRVKGGPKYLGRFHDQKSKIYWNIFGFDQMFHHICHICYIWVIISIN